MLFLLVLSLVFADTGILEEETKPFCFGVIPQETAEATIASKNLSIGKRIAKISESMLGTPYEDGPTGEGWGPDPDIPVRYDVYDCVTFVEEVFALAFAGDPLGAPYYRKALRFKDGIPTYENRNHFFAAEWIPNNVRSGLIRDITQDLGEAELLLKTVLPSTWANWRRTKLFMLPMERLPIGNYSLPVLPLDEALRVVDKIPAGSLVVTVRIPIDHIPILVTHLGITISGETPLMRHATRMSGKEVKDNTLTWYLEHLKSYDRWPVAGVNILMPLEQGPRIAQEE